jgi:hypothetical protein
VSRLAEANTGPSQEHLNLIYHLYRYIKGTATYSIEPGGYNVDITDIMIQTFADVSLADRLPTRHSTAGHTVFIAGGPVY